MFDSIGLAKVLRGALYLNALLAVALATNRAALFPEMPFLSVVSITVIASSAVILLLGETPLFPWLSSWPVLWRIFPNITGEYEVELASNWSVIEARNQGRAAEIAADGSTALFKKSGKMKITTRLTRIDISLKTNDNYLTSETAVCSVRRENGEKMPVLFYVYESFIGTPKPTDSQRHFGAARIAIPLQRRPKVLEGHYWTDRNWHQGLNTAGRIKLRRL